MKVQLSQTLSPRGAATRRAGLERPRAMRAARLLAGFLLVLLEIGSCLFQGIRRLGLAGDDRLDHLDHDVLEALVVLEERLRTTIADTVDERLPEGILLLELVNLRRRTQRGEAGAALQLVFTLRAWRRDELGEFDRLVLDAGTLEDGKAVGYEQRARALSSRAERQRRYAPVDLGFLEAIGCARTCLKHADLAVEEDGAHFVLLVGRRAFDRVRCNVLIGLQSCQHFRAVEDDLVAVDDLAVVAVNPVQELVHGVVEGLGRQAVAGNAGLFLDRLGVGDFLSPSCRRLFRIEASLLEEVLVPVERLGREGDRHAPLLATRGHGTNYTGIIGLLFVVRHRDRNDQIVLGELLERTRADIGHGDRRAGGSERRCLVLALFPADDFRLDGPARILVLPLLDIFHMDRVDAVAAIDPADFLVGGMGRHGAKRGGAEQGQRKQTRFEMECHV
ncbi:hypothetical protein RHSP_08477 [Rhizobium freirei PRF 81]|uniref:Uncharacterized protein n=1 Tax=Rhizobium freirei PRF 81 TaxID=363754 RepID=N6U325_9HYPH|nr:hypothetical protein RHSP_08477 [Rhizobium freirei PRF 81]